MKSYNKWLLLGIICCWSSMACAQLQLLPGKEPQCVFAGDARNIAVVWHNTGDKTADAEIHMRLYQTSSATAVQLSEMLWKKLQVLPQQTVIESARLDFPTVNAETKFLIQWLKNTNHVIGTTEVLVYPTNLLSELKPLAGEEPLGVLDPQNQLKPLLKNSGVDFVDLGNSELENFPGKLAIVGSFASVVQVPTGLTKRVEMLAKKGVAVVWIQPPENGKKLQPSFYLVPEGKGAVVIAQADLTSDLLENPESQLNLIYFCKLALHPQRLTLPDLSLQP